MEASHRAFQATPVSSAAAAEAADAAATGSQKPQPPMASLRWRLHSEPLHPASIFMGFLRGEGGIICVFAPPEKNDTCFQFCVFAPWRNRHISSSDRCPLKPRRKIRYYSEANGGSKGWFKWGAARGNCGSFAKVPEKRGGGRLPRSTFAFSKWQVRARVPLFDYPKVD